MTREQAAALLGLGDIASRSDILRAYSRSARLSHPDLLVDPTPEAVRVANERFVLLTAARDLLLSAPGSVGSADGPRGASAAPHGGDGLPDAGDGGAGSPPSSPRVAFVYDGAGYDRGGRRTRHGMGSSIVTVIVLALILVSVVSWQDSWRSRFVGAAARDLTADTRVTTVTDPLATTEDCPRSGSCVILSVTAPEDCATASARFEVTPSGSGDPTTETRELTGLRAGTPEEVALPGRSATLLFLGCAA